MLNKMNITICPIEGVYVTEGEGALQTKKFLEMDDLRDIFTSNVQLETGILPKGCLYYLKQDGKTILLIAQEARIRRILYRRGGSIQEYNIPTPAVVFGLVMEAGTLVQSYCAASNFPIASNESQLFRFPFGNVYGDARICWGNADIEPIRQLSHAAEIPNIFFEAPFNGDLSGDANSSGLGLSEYFQDLNGQEAYPTNHLVSCDISSVAEMIRRCKRSVGLE